MGHELPLQQMRTKPRKTGRLDSPRGQRIYRRRKWAAETPFAILKERCGLRQFLLRGLANVRMEWLWACTAFNLAKLVRDMAALRRKLAAVAI